MSFDALQSSSESESDPESDHESDHESDPESNTTSTTNAGATKSESDPESNTTSTTNAGATKSEPPMTLQRLLRQQPSLREITENIFHHTWARGMRRRGIMDALKTNITKMASRAGL